ncbi:MAG: nucleotide exchange factor GrpE [Kiritimatiellae bacterium]|nr:nucleotide exchange factor GrpE [Kiritimatiellia bacterium]
MTKSEQAQEEPRNPEDPVLAQEPTEPAPGAASETATESTNSEVAQLKDRLLRLQADFDNFRKRTVREREGIIARATEDLLEDILPVVDHLELGLKTAADHDTDDAVQQGFQLVYDQLLAALKSHGAEPVETGEVFDPHAHEAISHVPSEEIPADQIVAVVRKGFKVRQHLVRPAQVVVSSGPGKAG